MRATRIAISVALGISSICHAATDRTCLQHLGGAFSGVECFNGLSNDLKNENKKLAEAVTATIPDGNRNRRLLAEYLRDQSSSQNFCELSRQSMTNWVREAATVNPRYHDYDVAYYECVYGLLDQQNKFLKSLLKNARQE